MHDIFFKDFGWKLLSVCLSVVIWLTVHKILSDTPDTSPNAHDSTLIYSNVPVLAVSSSGDVRGYHTTPAMVAVTLDGPASLIAQLEEAEIHAIVDLTDTATNKTSHATVQLSPPRGVTVKTIAPEEVIVYPPGKP